MKKSLSLALSLIMIIATLTALPFTAMADDSGVCGDGVTYSFDSANYTLTISGNGSMYDYDGSISQPWYSYKSEIYTVTVEEGVTYIGNSAFSAMSNLWRVNLPSGLLEIGNSAFYGSSTSILMTNDFLFPDSVTRIGSNAFAKTKLVSICFQGNSLKTIGAHAFADTKLSSIYIPPSVTNIGGRAFGVVTDGSNYKTVEGFKIQGLGTDNAAYTYAQNPGGQYYSPMPALSYDDISNGVTGGCSYAFDIETGTLTVSKSGDGRMSENDYEPWYSYRFDIKSIIVNEGVIYIGPSAFASCHNATNLSLPESLIEIDESAFFANGLKEIKLPSNLTTIGNYAFQQAPELTSITLPNNLKTIGRSVFLGCPKLKSVIIPSSVTSIGGGSFGWGFLSGIIDGGFTIYSSCNNDAVKAYMDECGKDDDGNEIKWEKTHNFVGNVTTPAAEGTAGVMTYTCAGCGQFLKTEAIPALPINTAPAQQETAPKANPLKVKAKKPTVKFAKLKKKAQTLALKKTMTVTNAQGTVTYKLSSAKFGKKNFKNKFSINKKTGKLTLKKGLKKGTYKVKIQVSASGNNEYKSALKTVTVTIKVK